LLAQRGVVSAPARNRMSSSEAPETYQPGELSFSASVEVTFDLVTGTVAR
jgi:uncharacterized protein YggE